MPFDPNADLASALLAVTPVDELLALSMLQPDQVTDSLHAYQISKRGSALRVMAEAVRWGKREAFIAGSDFLMDGSVMAAYWFGELSPT